MFSDFLNTKELRNKEDLKNVRNGMLDIESWQL